MDDLEESKGNFDAHAIHTEGDQDDVIVNNKKQANVPKINFPEQLEGHLGVSQSTVKISNRLSDYFQFEELQVTPDLHKNKKAM
jgi:hypothetical protein